MKSLDNSLIELPKQTSDEICDAFMGVVIELDTDRVRNAILGEYSRRSCKRCGESLILQHMGVLKHECADVAKG